jgi:hypothetical protein
MQIMIDNMKNKFIAKEEIKTCLEQIKT